ncbi:DnaT-like ssDNA-binding protein [Gemmatimonas sp.]|uniref:DnaT-like ssDNA-binding protein n=1 Tax=Gemmatimonas sp. TaxID=1962908 RepID=UPI0035684DF4
MPTVITTSGDATANSYASVATATTYLDARLNSSAWTLAAVGDQERAVIEASRTLDRLDYTGWRVNATQALSWPREDAENPDAPYLAATDTLLHFGITIIPTRLVDATCELALEFLRAGTSDVAGALPNAGIITKTVDVLSTTYAEPYLRAQGLARYPRVAALIAPLLDGAKTGGLSVVRV